MIRLTKFFCEIPRGTLSLFVIVLTLKVDESRLLLLDHLSRRNRLAQKSRLSENPYWRHGRKTTGQKRRQPSSSYLARQGFQFVDEQRKDADVRSSAVIVRIAPRSLFGL